MYKIDNAGLISTIYKNSETDAILNAGTRNGSGRVGPDYVDEKFETALKDGTIDEFEKMALLKEGMKSRHWTPAAVDRFEELRVKHDIAAPDAYMQMCAEVAVDEVPEVFKTASVWPADAQPLNAVPWTGTHEDGSRVAVTAYRRGPSSADYLEGLWMGLELVREDGTKERREVLTSVI